MELRRLTLSYPGGQVLLRDFSMRVEPGETVALTGESGVGKSTVLRCICGLIPHSIRAEMTGEVLLLGRAVGTYPRAQLAQAVGVVFQNPEDQLFCDTVEDELAFGLENLRVPPEEMERRIAGMLELTGLQRYRMTSPNRLSGGQKQLAVLAAVLAMQPAVLLLDEALSQLDEEAVARMLELLGELRRRGQTIVMVEHDGALHRLADRVILVKGGGGLG